MNLELYKQQRDQEQWRIDEKILTQLNEVRKKFFETSWELLKKYNIPDELRLVEKQVSEYVQAIKDPDLERRYRKLELMEKEFIAFPPYWYYLGVTAQQLNKNAEALKCFDNFNKINKNIFRKDPFVVSVNMNKIVLVENDYDSYKIIKMLENIVQNSDNTDWNNILFAALQYMKLGEFETAKELIVRNIDYEHEISLHKRILGEIYLETKSNNELGNLIDEMVKSDLVKNQDTLYLFGKTNDIKIIRKIENQINSFQLQAESHLIGDHSLLLTMHPKWVFDNITVNLDIEGQSKTNDSITPDPNGMVMMRFDNCFNYKEFTAKGMDQDVVINLHHNSYPVKIVFVAKIIKEVKETSKIGRWLGNDATYTENNIEFVLSKVIFNEKEYSIIDNKIVL